MGGLIATTGAAAALAFSPSKPTPAATAPQTVAATTAAQASVSTHTPEAASAVLTASATSPAKSAAQAATQTAAATTPTAPHWVTAKVRRGQTLSDILTAQGVATSTWRDLVNAGGNARELVHLKVGAELHMKLAGNELQAVRYAYDPTHTLQIERTGDTYSAHTQVAELTHRRAVAHGTISTSLFASGENAGLNDRQIMKFAHIFAYDVDFTQDVHPGDHFTVVYDQVYNGEKKLRNGPILAAEIQTNGHDYRAVRYTEKDGDSAYFTPSGHSLHREFLRTPVAYTRISSGFSYARLNPVLHVVRPHYGTDFAAPMGTPIHATAAGTVAYLRHGYNGGYGNCIKIKTGGKYETIYGHMSRFRRGLHRGDHVKQDEVIGYVGMTGLATGPHVHYEIRVNGVPKNPMTIKLPNRPSLPGRALPRFRQQTAGLVTALNTVDTRQYAANGPTIGTR
ncbi:MAG TPA: peptidoglycan DD-metalloendopeptidase family protein [Nevskiaceae bacterium]|nr:peptidoglycan DD-metalloendopeptidase family protein [Nevskiaceae bacterium]